MQTRLDHSRHESTVVSPNRLCIHVSTVNSTPAPGKQRTSIPFVSILSYFSGFVQYSPAYRFLLMSKYGKFSVSFFRNHQNGFILHVIHNNHTNYFISFIH